MRDAFWRRWSHTLNLGLHIVDGIGRLHLKGDSLTREGFDEDLHGGLEETISTMRARNGRS